MSVNPTGVRVKIGSQLAYALVLAALLSIGPASLKAYAATGTSPSGSSSTQSSDGKDKKGQGSQTDSTPKHQDTSQDGDPKILNNPVYKEAVVLIKSQDYRTAITKLQSINQPNDPDVLNLLGYSHRKLGMIEKGMDFYHQALEQKPAHKSANEYLGEAYLQKNDLAKAKTQLAKLKQICGVECHEYQDLAEEIEKYIETNH